MTAFRNIVPFIILGLSLSSSALASEGVVYQCRGKNVLAVVSIKFQNSSWRSERKKTPYQSITKIWIDKDPNQEFIFRNSNSVDFFQQEHRVGRTSWWERDYNRKVIRLGGAHLPIDTHGTQRFFTLNTLPGDRKADLLWGHADQRGGPDRACILGQCGPWRNSNFNAKCKVTD